MKGEGKNGRNKNRRTAADKKIQDGSYDSFNLEE